MAVRTIIARYAGTCGDPDCGQPIAIGDTILYGGRGKVAHSNGTCSLENVAAGPTTRERKLARAERLRGWSESNEAKAETDLTTARQMASIIPLGQPILVGHHSERGDRNYRGRIDRKFDRGFETLAKSQDQARRADSIEAAADNAIYSDDPDAIERLTEKLAALEAERAAINAYNKAVRKGAVTDELVKALAPKWRSRYADSGGTIASYATSNLTGNIGRTRKRLEWLKREAVNA